MTASPGSTPATLLSRTVPARSMPGTKGEILATRPFSVAANASLKLTLDHSTSTTTSPAGRWSDAQLGDPAAEPVVGLLGRERKEGLGHAGILSRTGRHRPLLA